MEKKTIRNQTPKDESKTKISVYMDIELYNKVKVKAEQDGRKLANYVLQLIKKDVEK